MITAIVHYKLPVAKGLISKHFIWSEHGIAGGVYQWESLEDAKAFYSGAITNNVDSVI